MIECSNNALRTELNVIQRKRLLPTLNSDHLAHNP